MPSGLMDLSEKNIRQWFEAGAMCLRIASPLFPKESIAIKDWVKIEQHISTTRTLINLVKKSVHKEISTGVGRMAGPIL
jgi:2-dehydro-3-deoxyphosphogluconate aldolase/(4S)-4-hydroxy-2-oxoglutarate aldolase